ncbi:Egg protein, partial [Schistosoma japonicum]
GILEIFYSGVHYCQLHPEIDDFIWKLATMLTQEYFRNPMNCPITLKITKGIYNGGEDGICQAQTTESNCTTQSIRNVTCTWCPEIDMCVLV